jgi:hypothetical protein
MVYIVFQNIKLTSTKVRHNILIGKLSGDKIMLHLAQGMSAGSGANRYDATYRASQSASQLYQRACGRGWLGQIWATLTRRPRHLITLTEIQTGGQAGNRYSAGMQTVPIDQIRGSHGRCRDFDSAFYPLQHHTRSRWLRVASARQQGIALPPVELTQVGEVYFVRDGHHRISVARALGQTDIEAEVRVWQ